MRGFTLLEAILALGLFSMAALGLAGGIQKMLSTSLHERERLAIADHLESVLCEERFGKILVEGDFELGNGPGGIGYFVTKRRVELTSESGAELSGLWEIVVRAQRTSQDNEVIAELSTIHYENLRR